MGRQLYLVFFFGGLTASPAPRQPGTTRCDVTLARECQRLCVVVLYFGEMFVSSSRFFAE